MAFALLCWLLMAMVIYLPNYLLITSGSLRFVEDFKVINVVLTIVAGSACLYVGVCMLFALARRLRDAGFAPWLAFLYPVLLMAPVVGNFAFLIMATFCLFPSKVHQDKTTSALV